MVDNPCQRVFDLAEEWVKTHPRYKRREFLAHCVANGITYYTARTMYQRWVNSKK